MWRSMFYVPYWRDLHVSTQEGQEVNQPYQCSKCGDRFSTYEEWETHREENH